MVYNVRIITDALFDLLDGFWYENNGFWDDDLEIQDDADLDQIISGIRERGFVIDLDAVDVIDDGNCISIVDKYSDEPFMYLIEKW